MGWMNYLPVAFWCLWVFLLGLMVGSFVNVLIARLPFEKSIVWPSSRCFACYQPIRLSDNIPIVGYLRLRGRCRHCGVKYSSRYLWVELGTGLGWLALFITEILFNWHGIPALAFNPLTADLAVPPWRAGVYFLYHAILLSCLIAAAVIDAEHREIPTLITFTGLGIGVVGGTLFPWPWPNPAAVVYAPGALPTNTPWIFTELWGRIPVGLQPWPFWGPTFAFAPPGSLQMGLLNSLIGALAGSLVVRLIKWLFEVGFGREALGLGDADLLMMAGAFLGWQIAVLSLFVGAMAALVLKVLALVLGDRPTQPAADTANPQPFEAGELPFAPGLALGVVITWFAWPWLGPRMQPVFFDALTFGVAVGVLCVGMLAAGLLLRRPEADTTETPLQGQP
jgi:leader peptidase (prepilin peptidase)/N-methyltransferase